MRSKGLCFSIRRLFLLEIFSSKEKLPNFPPSTNLPVIETADLSSVTEV